MRKIKGTREMFEIIPKRNGQLPKAPIDKLGGRYGILERFKVGGIGSPKMFYKGGNEVFDLLSRQISGEETIVNIELLKSGLLVRAYSGQRSKTLGIPFTNISAIHILSSSNKEDDTNDKNQIKTIVFELKDHQDIICFVNQKNLSDLIKYFQKSEFGTLLNV